MNEDNNELVALTDKLAADVNNDAPDFMDLLQTINPKVARAVQLHLTGAYKTAQIADMLSVSSECVRKWLLKPEIKKYVSSFQQYEALYLQSRLKAQATLALEKMGELLESPIDGVKFQAAKDLLDRAGFKPEQKIQKNVTIQTFEQKLNNLIDSTVEVDYEEVNDEQ